MYNIKSTTCQTNSHCATNIKKKKPTTLGAVQIQQKNTMRCMNTHKTTRCIVKCQTKSLCMHSNTHTTRTAWQTNQSQHGWYAHHTRDILHATYATHCACTSHHNTYIMRTAWQTNQSQRRWCMHHAQCTQTIYSMWYMQHAKNSVADQPVTATWYVYHIYL